MTHPEGVAVDAQGNVFASTVAGGVLREFPYSNGAYGAAITFGTGIVAAAGYRNPVAVDANGRVYVVDRYYLWSFTP